MKSLHEIKKEIINRRTILSSKGFNHEQQDEIFDIAYIIVEALAENSVNPSELVIEAVEMFLEDTKKAVRN